VVDLLVEVRAGGTTKDLIDAVATYLNLPEDPEYGLLRTMVKTKQTGPDEGIRYLPGNATLADLGLLDGVRLTLASMSLRPAPVLHVDLDQAEQDLYLIDERGTHRGRVTRLADGSPVYVGRNPAKDGVGQLVFVDDGYVEEIALRLTNQRGAYVYCRVEQPAGRILVDRIEQPVGWVLAGEQVNAGTEISLLPGSTISFVRNDTVYVSFVVATKAALHGRSPVGRVQFDVAARRSRPKYEPLREGLARVKTQPQLPDPRPFPMEQVVLPVAMVGALWLGTHNPLSLVTAPIAAAVPIFSNRRQRRQEKQRFERERGQWLLSLEETSKELTRLSGDEEGNLRLENPAAEAWALRAYRRLAGLWERDTGQEDFLQVRLGLGRLHSRYETRLEEGTDIDDPEFRRIMLGEGRLPGKDVVRPVLFRAPVTKNLREHHLGLVGPARLVDATATDLLVQIACAHPPGAVGIAALLPASAETIPEADDERKRYEWLKWLPHTRAGSTLLPSSRIAAGRDACDAFLADMQELHTERREHRADESPSSYAVVVVHEAAEVDIALLTEVCDLADGLVRVLWLGSSKDTAPQLIRSLVEVKRGTPLKAAGTGEKEPANPRLRQSRKGRQHAEQRDRTEKVADLRESTGTFCGEDDEPLTFELNMFRAEPVDTVHALASLYDPRSSGASAGVPQIAPLSAVTELTGISYERDRNYFTEPEGWRSLAKTLPIPIGLSDAGVLELDLIEQGPHMLIGGTTGSGKSELLQTVTCGTISRYSPNEVSLFLVDFKGGATFAPFRCLPHVVGFVTDLDQRNVNRALDFLRAELRRREQAFEELGNAKEYSDYLDRALDQERLEAGRADILPRLIVMFDEFATIVQDFERDTINAVIDIARRGRSWGVHLILATQQPTRDVVVPQVRGNVNARIALRTPSPDESQTIIDRPDAAHIPQNFKGRALMTLGGNRLLEFQTAFSGAPYIPEDRQSRVLVEPFVVTPPAKAVTRSAGQMERERDKQSQLQTLVDSVASLQAPPSQGARVMLPALEEQQPVPTRGELFRHGRGSPTILWLGRRDLPKNQRQDELTADLSRGGLCLVGPNRSGITTALVKVAEAFAQQVSPGTRATVISFDAANQLRGELSQRFENTVSLSMTRLDEVTRCIDQLRSLVRSRLTEDLDTAESDGLPAEVILLLVDGFDVLMRTLSAPGGPGLWAGRLAEVLTLGRRAGVYSCIAVRSLRELDRSIVTSQATTIALHAHYEELRTPQDARMPGFGLDPDGNLVQFFVPSPSGNAQSVFDGELRNRFAPDLWRRTPVGLPPFRTDNLVACLGIEETSYRPYLVSLAESHVLVVGSTRSGRTKLLLTIASQLAAESGAPAAFFTPRGLPQAALSPAIRPVMASELLELGGIPADKRMAWLAGLGTAQLKDGRTMLLIDDYQSLDALENSASLKGVLGQLYTQALIQPIAITTVGSLSGTLIEPMKKSGVTVYLRPAPDRSDVDNGYRVRGIPLRHRPGIVYKTGDVIIQTEDEQVVAHLPELEETDIAP
jgi:S-DNA-T family DNA segregation ATPase FtsK/SpoIIIE